MGKCNMTRPSFLLKFLSSANGFTEDELMKMIPDYQRSMYCCYNILQPFDFELDDIKSASYDHEDSTFCIHMRTADQPKMIKEKCHKSQMNVLGKEYLIKAKAREKFIYIQIILLDEEDDN